MGIRIIFDIFITVINEDIVKFSKIFKIVLSMCNEFNENKEEEFLNDRVLEWKNILMEKNLIFDVLKCGRSMDDEIIIDISSIDTQIFIQTEFMKKVYTQKKEFFSSYSKIESIFI